MRPVLLLLLLLAAAAPALGQCPLNTTVRPSRRLCSSVGAPATASGDLAIGSPNGRLAFLLGVNPRILRAGAAAPAWNRSFVARGTGCPPAAFSVRFTAGSVSVSCRGTEAARVTLRRAGIAAVRIAIANTGIVTFLGPANQTVLTLRPGSAAAAWTVSLRTVTPKTTAKAAVPTTRRLAPTTARPKATTARPPATTARPQTPCSSRGWMSLDGGLVDQNVYSFVNMADGSVLLGGTFRSVNFTSGPRRGQSFATPRGLANFTGRTFAPLFPEPSFVRGLSGGFELRDNFNIIDCAGYLYISGRTALFAGGHIYMRDPAGEWAAIDEAYPGIPTAFFFGNMFGRGVCDASRGKVYFEGSFFDDFGPVKAVAAWDQNARTWSAMGTGLGRFASQVRTLAVDVTSGLVYAGGEFLRDGPNSRDLYRVAVFDGTSWENLGGGTDGAVKALAVGYGTSEPFLYVGGEFSKVYPTADRSEASAITVNNIAIWRTRSRTWSRLPHQGPASAIGLGPLDLILLGVSAIHTRPYCGAPGTCEQDSTVLLGGYFRTFGPVSTRSVVRYRPLVPSVEALGDGVPLSEPQSNDGFVDSLGMGPGPCPGEEYVYAGGTFMMAPRAFSTTDRFGNVAMYGLLP